MCDVSFLPMGMSPLELSLGLLVRRGSISGHIKETNFSRILVCHKPIGDRIDVHTVMDVFTKGVLLIVEIFPLGWLEKKNVLWQMVE